MKGFQMTQTKQIHQGAHYQAFTLKGSLIVHKRNQTQGGKQLIGDQAPIWIEAIKTAIDKKEADLLCKAILND